MRRVIRPVEISLVAAIAICRQGCVVVIRMTLRTWHGDVRARQRKLRCAVIEGGRAPRGSCMALRAISGEPCGHVVRISSSREIRLVAGVTGCGRRYVVVVHMALRAGERGMRAGQRVMRINCVIELRIEPVAG